MLTKQFMLESLTDEQRTVMRLMKTNEGIGAAECRELPAALLKIVNAIRALKQDKVTPVQAAREYQVISTITADCDTALAAIELETRQQQREQDFNALLRQWYNAGWIEVVDNVWQMTPLGRSQL